MLFALVLRADGIVNCVREAVAPTVHKVVDASIVNVFDEVKAPLLPDKGKSLIAFEGGENILVRGENPLDPRLVEDFTGFIYGLLLGVITLLVQFW
jgi:hypothetical protein